jgi:hypothetical protein
MKHSEEALQTACADFMNLFCPLVLYFMIPNGAYIGSGRGRFAYLAKLKRMGLRPGAPDMILLFPKGGLLLIEFKSAKGKVSKEQADFAARCYELGVLYEVANSFEKFVETLKLHGVPMKQGMYGKTKI